MRVLYFHSLFPFFILFLLLNNGIAQDEYASKVTEDAINARISELRMGDIVVHTSPDAQYNKPATSFYLGQPFRIALQKWIPMRCLEKTVQCT
ncbi:hypothetical protein JW960_28160 [candidate division KSB1 bacterium]|nr:hypothetical protein [candidate division KSB1 bacterium]